MILKVGLHQVDSGEEFIGRHHTQQVFTWNIEKPWQSCPGADKNFPKPCFFQLIECGCFTRNEIFHKSSSSFTDPFDHMVDETIRQSKLRNSVTENPAQFMKRFKNCHRITCVKKQEGIDQTCRSGTDDCDRGLFCSNPWIRNIALGVKVQILFTQYLAFREEPFYLTDFNRFDARADPLALDFLGADTAGDIRQGVGGLHQFKGILEAALTD